MALDFGGILPCRLSSSTQLDGNGANANGPHVNLYVEMETGNEFWQVLLWNIIVVVAVCVRLSCLAD